MQGDGTRVGHGRSRAVVPSEFGVPEAREIAARRHDDAARIEVQAGADHRVKISVVSWDTRVERHDRGAFIEKFPHVRVVIVFHGQHECCIKAQYSWGEALCQRSTREGRSEMKMPAGAGFVVCFRCGLLGADRFSIRPVFLGIAFATKLDHPAKDRHIA